MENQTAKDLSGIESSEKFIQTSQMSYSEQQDKMNDQDLTDFDIYDSSMDHIKSTEFLHN
jgi:hypothetical protein